MVTYCNFPFTKCKTGTDTLIFKLIVTFQHVLLTFRIGSKPKIRTIELPYMCCMESTVILENVVASTALAEDFDLEKMMESGLEGAEYNKAKFPGLVYRIENPKAAFLIFTSGKVVCTGAKSIENAHKAIITLANTLKDIGFDKIYPEPEVHVQNIVASADLKTTLNLNTIAIAFGLENVEYEPEVFPGLIYRVEAPKVVVLVFSSGKLVITGGKTPEDCDEGLRIISTEFDNLGLLY